jgi:hypothetical protein
MGSLRVACVRAGHSQRLVPRFSAAAPADRQRVGVADRDWYREETPGEERRTRSYVVPVVYVVKLDSFPVFRSPTLWVSEFGD